MSPAGAIDLCSLQFAGPHSTAKPCSAAALSLPPLTPASLALSSFSPVCCGKRQRRRRRDDVSDLGLFPTGSRGRPCLTAIRSFPPIPISRRAAGRQRMGTKCRSAETAAEEPEPGSPAPRRGVRRGGGALQGHENNSL